MEPQKTTVQDPIQPPTTVPKEHFLKELVKFIVIAAIIVAIIRTYIGGPFIVSGRSMDPTFKDMQYLVVDYLTWHFEAPQREDVVIFRYPLNPKTFYIKRIIGLPGETLSMKNGVITIVNAEHPEGMVIDDSHVNPTHRTYDNFTITLGATEYFVMGDNRSESSDSRIWGPVEKKFLVGRPFLRIFPFSIFPGK